MVTEQELAELVDAARQEIQQAAAPEALEALRVKYLGRKGSLTQILRGLKDLDADSRRQVGARANRAKEELEAALAQALTALKEAALRAAAPAIDVTLPGRRGPWDAFTPSPASWKKPATSSSTWASRPSPARKWSWTGIISRP
jgi:phenylalanyl-tRNA synthetase alpha subunit